MTRARRSRDWWLKDWFRESFLSIGRRHRVLRSITLGLLVDLLIAGPIGESRAFAAIDNVAVDVALNVVHGAAVEGAELLPTFAFLDVSNPVGDPIRSYILRSSIGEALERLALQRPNIVVVDFDLDEPSGCPPGELSSGDSAVMRGIQALQRSGSRIVLVERAQMRPGKSNSVRPEQTPFPLRFGTGDGISVASSMIRLDTDNYARRIEIRSNESAGADQSIPNTIANLLANGTRLESRSATTERLIFSTSWDDGVPRSSTRKLSVFYVPIAQLPDVAVSTDLSRSVVIVGTSEPAAGDYLMTPLGRMPGALFHANAALALVSGRTIVGSQHRWLERVLSIIGIVLAAIWLAGRPPLIQAIFGTAVVVLVVFPVSILLLPEGSWLSFLAPFLSIFAGYVVDGILPTDETRK